jgi:GTP-binding protein EngB required for normal cell division
VTESRRRAAGRGGTTRGYTAIGADPAETTRKPAETTQPAEPTRKSADPGRRSADPGRKAATPATAAAGHKKAAGGRQGSSSVTPRSRRLPTRGAAVPGGGAADAGLAQASHNAQDLSARLSALAGLVQIGSARAGDGGGFDEKLLADARELLTRAGERLRLSAGHTVVSLAGGTGSGKSSLFNRLSGADFSTVGVTRPVTRDVHACVWGVSGSGPLLEWLGIPRRYRYARASALDPGEASMAGLVLLDLPDHDSVMGHATDQVDRLVSRSDLMIWILDPQKYADAAVHRRFLVPLAGHSEVVTVVLNQSDLLSPAQSEDCVQDLRRLLDAEELHDVQILVTSAASGAGIDELRKVLIEAVSARKAATARITADVDAVSARFEQYGVYPVAEQDQRLADTVVPGGAADRLGVEFTRAAGVPAIGDALSHATELRALDYVGWPVSWMLERLTRRDPVRKIRLGRLWAELRGVSAGPSGAQQADIDNALTELADEVTPRLPGPWDDTVRVAVRSKADQIPAALGKQIGDALPAQTEVSGWWRFVGVCQGLLLGCVIVGIAWMIAILGFGLGHVGDSVPWPFSRLLLLPVIGAAVAAALWAGWLIGRQAAGRVREQAEAEQEDLVELIGRRMVAVADDLVIVPARQELAELDRFRAELRIARGAPGPAKLADVWD